MGRTIVWLWGMNTLRDNSVEQLWNRESKEKKKQPGIDQRK